MRRRRRRKRRRRTKKKEKKVEGKNSKTLFYHVNDCSLGSVKTCLSPF